jgi:hypothetical protein
MRRQMRTNRVLMNQAGTLSDSVRTDVKVHFDLVETQDIVYGVPDLEFSFGNLRFEDEAKNNVAWLALAHSPVVLAGGGIQTTILLSGLNAFTVMSVIKETRVFKADVAA